MIEEKIPVQIFGQTYEIVGNPTETLYYHSLAQFVEDKMKEIQLHSNIVSSQKIAVLAALNLADELLHEREKKTDSGNNLGKKHEELIDLLDEVLKQTAPSAPDPSQPKKNQSRKQQNEESLKQHPTFNF